MCSQGSDDSMIEKLHAALTDMKGYERPRGNECKFSIHHYAGKVGWARSSETHSGHTAQDLTNILYITLNNQVHHVDIQ